VPLTEIRCKVGGWSGGGGENLVVQWDELASFSPKGDTAITIGVFDGVHLGHRHLIRHLVGQAEAMDLVPGVVTFQRHPQQVLNPEVRISYLTTPEERIALLKNLGVSFVVPLNFTSELAQTTARGFVMVLQRYLHMKALIVGPDFALGRNREGNAAVLFELGREMGFSVQVVPPLVQGGEVVSSSAIRKALAKGSLTKVRRMLGRPYRLSGPVVSGAERGRTLGFPTANLHVNSDRGLPADGVYATRTYIGGREYPSVTNVGTCPTFGQQERTVEAYILDNVMKLYGQEIKVDFVEHIREERRFASPEKLAAQISKDVERARAILRRED
jgi:riboflavin kinase/FMN adenylyltransferase